MFRSLLLTFFLSVCSIAQTAFPVQINSGNPAFPFPQFLPYTTSSGTLNNLANHNGVGVPHAELEQSIRDAYQIMMNRCSVIGKGPGGVNLIKFASTPSCTEGDGYAMLAAVAMADKTTFDGLWLWVHDNAMNKTMRYGDCQMSSPYYAYARLPGWTNSVNSNSATDGDVDIALALLMAYYQWGEFMGINDACGKPISYKLDAIEFLKALTDTIKYPYNEHCTSGDIGLDGYIKGGDSWTELTGWANNTAQSGFPRMPEHVGPATQHIDYTAPAYFHEFADFLSKEDSSAYAWNISQFRRCEASSDWLMGQLYKNNPLNIPSAGWVSISADNVPAFTQFADGEDFRLAWRTVLNYVWHGNSTFGWDPVTHTVLPGQANTFERDIGTRYGNFLWDSRQAPWKKSCGSIPNAPYTYWGPPSIVYYNSVTGDPIGTFHLNWVPGTGSVSAVAAQNQDLMAELFRQCEINWDVTTAGDGYLTSVPVYFHEWFRLLGMLVLSGNYHGPMSMLPSANVKAYLAIDKTFAFEKDTVTYTIDYRNYGSVDAAATTLTDALHPDFDFVSATGGGVFNAATHTVVWNIGTLKGFKSAAGIAPTKGQVTLKVKVGKATQKQYRNTVTISCANGPGWTSNEYPNRVTSVMERNYLDIAKRAVILHTTASKELVKPGGTVQFTIDFENTSDAGWINGGRSGVHFAFARDGISTMRFRLFHDADEAYIDYGNYRVSYFLFDTLRMCIQGQDGCTAGWSVRKLFFQGIDTVRIFQEPVTPGQDALGKWNQRVIIQFSDPMDPNREIKLAGPDWLLQQYYGIKNNIHRGGTSPLLLNWELYTMAGPQPVYSDDWSWNQAAVDGQAGTMFPISNDWSDPDKPNLPVTTWNEKACSTAALTIKNILVQEWDGYTWRRVAGDGPLPGRDVSNVVIRDTVPAGFTFTGFVGNPPFGIQPTITGNVISWTIPRLQVKQTGTITFSARADGSCPGAADRAVVNRAWIAADKESPFADSAMVFVSCDTSTRVKKRIIRLSPADSIADYPGSRRLIAITLVDTAGAVVTGEDAALSLVSSDPRLHAFADATSPAAISTVTLVNGRASIAVAGDTALSALLTVAAATPRPGTLYIPAGLSVTLVNRPSNWPTIVSAVMKDPAGNMVPGLVDVVLSDTFSATAALSSVQVSYGGATYTIPPASITRSGTSLLLAMPAGLPPDPTPSGALTLVISVNGAAKTESRPIIDGIGPQIKSAVLLEKSDPAKTMVLLAFSEPVQPGRILGKTLLGIVSGTSDTLVFTVDSTATRTVDGVFAVRAAAGTVTLKVGDRIRLVPDPASGIKDMSGVTPHPANPFVAITPGPAICDRAIYGDGNADGYVDTILLYFRHPVSKPLLIASFDWSDIHADSVRGARLDYYRGDSSVVAAAVDGAWTRRVLRTSRPMFVTILFSAFPDEKQSVAVQDSAAPVLTGATYYPGTTAASPDTVQAKFSEPIALYATNTPFCFLGGATKTEYSLSLSFLSAGPGDSTVRFLVNNAPGTFTIGDGDSVWMKPGAFGDKSGPKAMQNNAANRRVALTIVVPAAPIIVTFSNNPFSPATQGPLLIRVAYDASAVFFKAALINASAKLYDALGACVFETGPFVKDQQTGRGVSGVWPGTNRNGRRVGSGTYLALVTIRDGNGLSQEKRYLVGVRW